MPALETAGKIATGTGSFIRDNWKWIAVLILVILIFLIVRKNLATIKFWFTPRHIDLQPGENPNIDSTRQNYLKDLASRLYQDIYDTPITGHNTSIYEEALALTDNELMFMARYYRKDLTGGVTLWDDIDNELFVWTDVNTRLKARLQKVGEGSKEK